MLQDSNFLQLSFKYANRRCRVIHNLLRNYQDVLTKLTSDFVVSKPLGLRLGIYREFPSENFLVRSMKYFILSIKVYLSSTNLRLVGLPYTVSSISYIAAIDLKIRPDALQYLYPTSQLNFSLLRSQGDIATNSLR
jgi:hypothetical protein